MLRRTSIYKLLISFSGDDRDWVQRLCDAAGAIGVKICTLEQDPKPGQFISEKVKQQIISSNAVIVLLTLNSDHSAYTQQEVRLAQAYGKHVITLVQPRTESWLAMLADQEYSLFEFTDPCRAVGSLVAHLYRQTSSGDPQSNVGFGRDGNMVLFGFASLLLLALTTGQKKTKHAGLTASHLSLGPRHS
jgi:hypothetical protein